MLLKNIRKFNVFLIFVFLLNVCYSQYKANVMLLINEEYSRSILNFIKNSQKSIYIIMFQTGYYPEHPESVSNQILKKLIEAGKRNVKVEVILDLSKESSVKEKNMKTAEFLSENGIKVYFDKETKTTHIKLVIIDEKYVFTGSHNWNYYALEKNNEISVLIDSEELARSLIEYFKKLKKGCKLYRISNN